MNEICLGKINLTDAELEWFEAELSCGGIPDRVRIDANDEQISIAKGIVSKGLMKTDNIPYKFNKIRFY